MNQSICDKYIIAVNAIERQEVITPPNYNEIMQGFEEFVGTMSELHAEKSRREALVKESKDKINSDLIAKAQQIRIEFKDALREAYGLNLSIQQTDAIYEIAKGDWYRNSFDDIEIDYVALVENYHRIRNLEVI